MKVAQALVVGSDLGRVSYLRDVRQVITEGLEPYEEEIRAIEKMYMSIWLLHVYVDTTHLHKRSLVARVMQNETNFPNDNLLSARYKEKEREPITVYDVLANEYTGDVPFNLLPKVIQELDAAEENRTRYGESSTELRARLSAAINVVLTEAVGPPAGTQPEMALDRPSANDE